MSSGLEKDLRQELEALRDEMKGLIDVLKGKSKFGKARKLAAKMRSVSPDDPWLTAQLALCTYCDKALLPDRRISEAMEILGDRDISALPVSDADKRGLFRARAEAALSDGAYSEAAEWLARLTDHGPSDGERDAIAHRLFALAGSLTDPDAKKQVLRIFHTLMAEDAGAALAGFQNKVGLGLSGGGFRASLYHLGVLARLAETDVLRRVEVISTVSGGSIVGAMYYLEVRHLLMTKPDAEITREDYIEIVRRVQENFLAGIQSNLRIRAFSDFRENLKMIFSEGYSRSHRIGALYETLLFEKVKDDHPAGKPRHMADLLISPKDGVPDFKPRSSNWRRRAKVPVLLLNTTSLNTGHNWRFTGTYMGEPPGLLAEKEVDKNARYRRVRYPDAPTEALRNYRLGHAVAASASVPGLFEPLPLEGLYPDSVVRLVDGGVHDNQGVAGLMDEKCTIIVCSDASGQMHDQNQPPDTLLSVLARSGSVTMDRVREEQYQELVARLDDRLQGLLFVHMKKDFPVPVRNWVGCPATAAGPDNPLPYGIALGVQKKIAEIRTDLDAFSDVEAYALMASGYLMAEQEAGAVLKRCADTGDVEKWDGYALDAARSSADAGNPVWPFLELAPVMKPSPDSQSQQADLEEQLRVGASMAFRIWQLSKCLRYGSLILAAVALAGIFRLIQAYWCAGLSVTVGGVVLSALVVILPFIVPAAGRWFKRLFITKSARNVARDILIAFVGFFIARIHLSLSDPMFLKHGSLSRLMKKR
ncbi:hypothetical protein DENIS_1555 [Desulfonema ishimotonii]|uniref:PNPLA domain-containing protein n=1 Tax=Desulfonema ishimotonii TaxID=45657 RepID=A0A401FUH7_9BACT|nr:patatin-like phospholipase family protein [Desulfonema ishimotonii]GBC60598.1 hypothetical protein DENIS_1555 [Desulfonema ishimotonii]